MQNPVPLQDNDTTEVDEQRPSFASRMRGLFSTIGILLLAPLIAIFLTLFVFQSYQVDGPSMRNTLQNGDRLIVWKLARTWAKVTGHQYVPKRGDIIIFTQSGLSRFNDSTDTKQLVKRVIGLPGDHVVIKNGTITIYNSEHPEGFQPDNTLAYGKGDGILQTDNNIDITLKNNELFVCGDNRPDSLDSRYFGPITTDQVIGKLIVRILPLSDTKVF